MTETEYRSKVGQALPLLLEKIGTTELPLTVPVQPEADAKVNSCFYNVERKVSRDGGHACYGWAIRFSHYIVEAEKHAIWLSPANEYVDVTPSILNSDKVFFVIDDDFVYNGQLVDNIRLNLTGERIVDDWIAVSETIHILYTYGQRTGEDEIKLSENIAKAIQTMEQCANVFGPFLDSGGTYDGKCFCGNSLSYQQCHGFDLKEALAEILEKAASSVSSIQR